MDGEGSPYLSRRGAGRATRSAGWARDTPDRRGHIFSLGTFRGRGPVSSWRRIGHRALTAMIGRAQPPDGTRTESARGGWHLLLGTAGPRDEALVIYRDSRAAERGEDGGEAASVRSLQAVGLTRGWWANLPGASGRASEKVLQTPSPPTALEDLSCRLLDGLVSACGARGAVRRTISRRFERISTGVERRVFRRGRWPNPRAARTRHAGAIKTGTALDPPDGNRAS